MRKSSLLLTVLFIVSACASQPSATPLPAQTATPVLATPVESALAPENSTAVPLDDTLTAHTVTFETPDGVNITGELYGSGEVAVIFSVMGNCKPGWREFAQLTAAQGLTVLTYQWRACRSNGGVDEIEIQKFLDDLRGAINFIREQGAQKIILAGASLGGSASAKLAVEARISGLIVIASPAEIQQWGFVVNTENLNTDIPKLFVTAQDDSTVPATFTRELFGLAAEPKEWQTYSGTAHGTDLFDGEHSEALTQRLLQFILDIANKEK